MIRSFLKTMNMPSIFWGEAARHSVYILNRLPTRALSEVTPYQAWKNRKPDVGHVRVFGCVAHMKLPSVHTTKLSDRSKLVVNLGREEGTKAYRLYDPNTGSIHVSRDVIFEEKRAWLWDVDQKTENSGSLNSFIVVGNQLNEGDEYGGYQSEEEPTTPSMNTGSNAIGTENSETGENSTQNSAQSKSSSSSSSAQSKSSSSSSSEPQNFRLLSDIYNETEELEAENEMLLLGIDEPKNYIEAASEKAWEQAMNTEIEAIEKNNTWTLVELPPGNKAVGLKWVYKLKRDTNGEIIKHKARLVAKGYVQKQGVDYDEVFAPVTRLETVRLLLALAAKNGWEVHHLDVKSAFLNGELQETVYVTQPEGFVKKNKEHLVYRLTKALYGLRQAPRAWYARLSKYLEKLGFTKCPYEHAVYTKKEGTESLIIGVYVDDLLVTGTSLSTIVKFKQQMSREFDMSDLGKLSHYLGIEVKQEGDHIELRQSAYARNLLEKAGLSDCNSAKYPMEVKLHIGKDEKGKAVDSTQFKSLVGGLRYLVHTRPDIAFAVGIVSRFMERPTMLHLNAVKRILRYIKGTMELGLVYMKGTGNYILSGYSDSDLAGNVEDRRSTGGMAFYLDESLITWVSQKQRCVALSSCEAEFMAATAAACQGIWLRNLLGQITDGELRPVTIYVDNKSAIDLAKNPVFHGRSKHIDIRYHFIRECVERGEIVIKHVRTDMQRADVLTKAMTTVKFERMRALLGLKNLQK